MPHEKLLYTLWILSALTNSVRCLPSPQHANPLNQTLAASTELIPPDFHVELDWDHAESHPPDIGETATLSVAAIRELARSPYTESIPTIDGMRNSMERPTVALLMRGYESRIFDARFQQWAVHLCYAEVAIAIREKNESPTCEFGLRNEDGSPGFDKKIGRLQFVRTSLVGTAKRDSGFVDNTVAERNLLSNTTSAYPNNMSLSLLSGSTNAAYPRAANQSSVDASTDDYGAIPHFRVDVIEILVEKAASLIGLAIIQLAAQNPRSGNDPLKRSLIVRYEFLDGSGWIKAFMTTANMDYTPSYDAYFNGLVALFRAMREQGRYGTCTFSIWVSRAGFARKIIDGYVLASEDNKPVQSSSTSNLKEV